MKISIKHIVAAALLYTGVLPAQTQLKSYSIGARAVHFYDLPSHRFDSELSTDMKGLNGKNTSPDLGLDIYLEKQFTPLWGIQMGFRKGGLTGSNDVEYFENDFSEVYGDILFNLSNLDKKRMSSRLNYYAKAGIGFGTFSAERFLISDNSANGSMGDNYWETRVGAGLQYELNSYLRLELEVAYNMALSDGFDGYNYSSGSDPYLSTGIGLAYTFGKKKNRPMYSVNFFGEEYFGTPKTATEDNKTDSLMAVQLAAARERMESMNEVIANQKAAIARLEEQRKKQEEIKVAGRELVFFDFDSAVLNEDAKRELSKVLKGNEGNIVLTGYADHSGDSAYNQKLKVRRAEAVKQFMVEVLGYETTAITLKPAKEIKDLKNNDFLNRKVVVEFYR